MDQVTTVRMKRHWQLVKWLMNYSSSVFMVHIGD